MRRLATLLMPVALAAALVEPAASRAEPAVTVAPTASTAPTGPPSPSPSSIPPDMAAIDPSCRRICSAYKNEKTLLQEAKSTCGSVPAAERAACEQLAVQNFSTRWLLAGPSCDAVEKGEKAKEFSRYAAIAYSVASAACFTACATPWAIGLTQTACFVSAGAGIGADVKATFETLAAGQTWATLAGVGTTLTATVTESIMAYAAISKSHRIEPCTAGTALGAVAIVKWAALYATAESTNKSCKNVTDNFSNLPEFTSLGLTPDGSAPPGGGGGSDLRTDTPPPGNNPGLTDGPPLPIVPASLPGGGGSPTLVDGGGPRGSQSISGSGLPPIEQAVTNNVAFGDALRNLARNDPSGSGVGARLPNANDLLDVLRKAGVDPSAVARETARNGPAAALGRLPSLTPPVRDLVRKLDQAVIAALSNPAGATAIAGGGKGAPGGGPARGGSLLDAYGSYPGAGGDKPAAPETTFGEDRLPATESNDIWHAGTSGSLFEIVSKRIGRSKSRVAALEWATPMNRMLNGLPARKRPESP